MDATEATIESALPGAQAVHASAKPAADEPAKSEQTAAQPPTRSADEPEPEHALLAQRDRERAGSADTGAELPNGEQAGAELASGEQGAELASSELADGELAGSEQADVQSELEDPSLAGVGKLDRRKLEEQLDALKRKEFELRRALTIADHPDLADAIRALEGRAYAIQRVETKLAQGLSKSEERRRETIEKKLGSLREKRAELDAQISTLEQEQQALGAERTQAFEAERRHALEQLLVTLGTHEPAFRAALLEPTALVPELTRFLPEIQTLAETLVAAREPG